MIQLPLRRLRDKFFPVPLPPPNSFSGQTILITGATAGLGLAAAKQFASLGAAEIIITARNKSKGELAKKKIEEASKYGGKGKGKGEKKVAVEVLELDMNRYDSCVKFVEGLKEKMRKKEGGATIECVVLNAGVCNPTFVESSEGW
jgi:NAD(P)-dependent dehydrogenase (short-subunit alcohol dehydrogenase family)